MKIVALIIMAGLLVGAVFSAIYFFSCHKSVTPAPKHLYKILAMDSWAESQKGDRLKLAWIDDTFIHLATDEQLDRVIEKFWGDKSSYVILTVDPTKFVGRLVHESNPGGTNKYYHLYNGHIPLAAVTHVRTVDR